MRPLVSILIPVYNAEKWLASAVQSAVDQTWPSTEIIVVDDGSTDGSLAVARSFRSRKIKIVDQANEGSAAARNRAIRDAQGDFIQFLDADDILAGDKIESQMNRLVSEPLDTVSTSTWARFYNDDLNTARFRDHDDFRDYLSPVEWLIQSWNGRGTMPPVAWLLPRSVVEKCGPWNESLTLNDDTEYFTRVVLCSSKIAFCKEARGYYRSGNPSLSRRKNRSALESYYSVCELCVHTLLAFEDSARTRRACANLWQYFAFQAYPYERDLVRTAEANARLLGGTDLKLKGRPAVKLLRRIIGWKAGKRIQRAYYRIRYS